MRGGFSDLGAGEVELARAVEGVYGGASEATGGQQGVFVSGRQAHALDSQNVVVLREHRERQLREKEKWGPGPGRTPATCSHGRTDSGSTPRPYRRPSAASSRGPTFRPSPCGTCGTSPRPSPHGSGGGLPTIKETLRHSTITLTSDTYTYTSLQPEVDKAAAEVAANLVPRVRKAALRSGCCRTVRSRTRPGTMERPDRMNPVEALRSRSDGDPLPASSGPCGTRTQTNGKVPAGSCRDFR